MPKAITGLKALRLLSLCCNDIGDLEPRQYHRLIRQLEQYDWPAALNSDSSVHRIWCDARNLRAKARLDEMRRLRDCLPAGCQIREVPPPSVCLTEPYDYYNL